MLKERAVELYLDHNCNCAEAILMAANDEYGLGLDEKACRLVGGFGGGMQCGSTCGTLLASISVISEILIKTKAHETDGLKSAVNEMIQEFTERMPSTLCDDLKPVFSVPGLRCIFIVEECCDALEAVIGRYVQLQ